MDVNAIAVFIPIAGIIGGISVAIVSIISRMRLRELRIRERIAMIEKGLVPPPEVDPAGFDRFRDFAALMKESVDRGIGKEFENGFEDPLASTHPV